MDIVQVLAFVSFITIGAISVILWWRQWRRLFRIRITGKVAAMNLKDAVAFVILIPVLLASSEGALWIYRQGWQDLPKVVSLGLEYGFIGAIFMVICFYVINRHALGVVKRMESETRES